MIQLKFNNPMKLRQETTEMEQLEEIEVKNILKSEIEGKMWLWEMGILSEQNSAKKRWKSKWKNYMKFGPKDLPKETSDCAALKMEDN